MDQNGDLIPLPLSGEAALPIAFVKSVPARFNGGFVQADYIIHPWIMAIARWDGVNSTADRINGLALSPDTPFFGPLHSSRERFTPGNSIPHSPQHQVLFEYQFRPQQTAEVQTSSLTGALIAVNPFRVNTALFGLEFVY